VVLPRLTVSAALLSDRRSRFDDQSVRNFLDTYAKTNGYDPLNVNTWYGVRLADLVLNEVTNNNPSHNWRSLLTWLPSHPSG